VTPRSWPVLCYDGSCGLCARSVQFVLRRERPGHDYLRFATLQGPWGARARAEHPDLAGVDSVVWLEADGRVSVRGSAVLAVLRYVGGWWGLVASVGSVVPRVLRDAIYDSIARRRYATFGRDTSCLLPTPEQRARFLDDSASVQ
jgi:predicted DCC family thiol-disulfide oxidoreductase YuxK